MKSLLVVTSFLGVALASTATTGSTTATTASTTATTATTLTTSHTTHTTHHTHSTHHTHKTHKHHHHHHHHHDPCCHSSKHHKPCHSSKHHHKPCCETKTVTTVIDRKPCCLYVFPCPTNTTSYITSTSIIAPSSQAVAPSSQVVVAPTSQAAVCTPCTSYVYQTTRPSLVCTTMIFCDVADQSENCLLENERKIESIANLALRSGGKVFVNGQLVVFERNNNGSNKNNNNNNNQNNIGGQQANDAPALIATGSKMASCLGVVIAAFMFA